MYTQNECIHIHTHRTRHLTKCAQCMIPRISCKSQYVQCCVLRVCTFTTHTAYVFCTTFFSTTFCYWLKVAFHVLYSFTTGGMYTHTWRDTDCLPAATTTLFVVFMRTRWIHDKVLAFSHTHTHTKHSHVMQTAWHFVTLIRLQYLYVRGA